VFILVFKIIVHKRPHFLELKDEPLNLLAFLDNIYRP